MKVFISIILLFLFTQKNFAQHSPDICFLPKIETLSYLDENDFFYSVNPVSKRPKASKLCPIVFKFCPREFTQTFVQFGKVKAVRFRLIGLNNEEKVRECRYKDPAAVNRGGKDDPYFSLLNW